MNSLSVRTALAAALWFAVAACGGQGMNEANPSPEEPRITASKGEEQAPPARQDQLVYGEPYTWEVEEGSVRMWVGTPTEANLHTSEYDENCTVDPDTCSKPGAPLEFLRVTVKLEGVGGRVEWAGLFEFTYETPGGDVLFEGIPPVTFEELYPLSSQVSHLASGQKVTGNVYFDAPAGGRVQVAAWYAMDQELVTWASS